MLQPIIEHHRREMHDEDNGEALQAWHGRAAQILNDLDSSLAGLLLNGRLVGPLPAEQGVQITLDLVGFGNQVEEDWRVITLPACPAAGDGLNLDGDPYGILARVWQSTDGKGAVRFAVQKVNVGSIQRAPASVVDVLNGGRA